MASGLMFTGVLATGTESASSTEGMTIVSPTDGEPSMTF